MERIKELFVENRDLCFAVLCLLCVLSAWLYADHHRNDAEYNHTDNAMADIDKRVLQLEARIADLQERIGKAEKTVQRVSETVSASRVNAETVAAGIGNVENRIDAAIQQCGRIENIINEIERANK